MGPYLRADFAINLKNTRLTVDTFTGEAQQVS